MYGYCRRTALCIALLTGERGRSCSAAMLLRSFARGSACRALHSTGCWGWPRRCYHATPRTIFLFSFLLHRCATRGAHDLFIPQRESPLARSPTRGVAELRARRCHRLLSLRHRVLLLGSSAGHLTVSGDQRAAGGREEGQQLTNKGSGCPLLLPSVTVQHTSLTRCHSPPPLFSTSS